jgi:CheY-like chemotaxis protein
LSPYILLAEDNAGDVLLVREVLKQHGISHSIEVLSDGDQAFRFIDDLDRDSKSPCPELFLLDLHLPKKGGDLILRHLRASERCGQTPVVILTSSDSPRDYERATRHAPLHFFRKPSSLDAFMELGEVVKSIVTKAETKD